MDMKMEKKIMARNYKKKFLIASFTLIMLLLFASTIKIYQIQHNSIWSEQAIKPLYQYSIGYVGTGAGGPIKDLTLKDLIQLYFILGTTKEYNPEKQHQYVPDGWILRDPYIIFDRNDVKDDVACRINWDYANNILFVYDENVGTQTEARRYYIDKKNADLLHKLYEKYILNLDVEPFCGFGS